MKRSLITAKVLLVTLAIACLCSTSIISGEHPWDGDGTGGRPGTSGDYQPGGGGLSTTDPKTGSGVGLAASVKPPMDPRGTWAFRLTMLTTKYFYGTTSISSQGTVKWRALEKRR